MKVIAEIVQWNDVIMLRTPSPQYKHRKYDFNQFSVPPELYDRWDRSIDEFSNVQYEIKKYQNGDLIFKGD
jgi:hypothetical protein